MNVYLDAIPAWSRQPDGALPELARDVVRSLQRDGFPLDDAGHLTGPLPAGGELGLRDLRLLRDPGVIEEHLDRMLANVENDPPAVIGAAKELVESVCKAILEDCGVPYAATATLPDLQVGSCRVTAFPRGCSGERKRPAKPLNASSRAWSRRCRTWPSCAMHLASVTAARSAYLHSKDTPALP